MPPLTRLTADDRADLVAYLDGELDEATTARIDQTVASNEVARREIERLSRVYDLLDELPKTEPSPEFTQSALSVVEQEVIEEGSIGRLQDLINRWRPLAIAGLAAMAMTGLGTVLGAAAFRAEGNRRLEAVPTAELLPTLQAIGDEDFLRSLPGQRSLLEQMDERTESPTPERRSR